MIREYHKWVKVLELIAIVLGSIIEFISIILIINTTPRDVKIEAAVLLGLAIYINVWFYRFVKLAQIQLKK